MVLDQNFRVSCLPRARDVAENGAQRMSCR